MSLKPAVMRDVLADTPAMTKVLGPKFGKQFTANPNVARYAFVLKFPDGVATGRSVSHALRKIKGLSGPTLIAGDRFTLEARQIAAIEGCDLLSIESAHAYVWTDATYARAREPFSSRTHD
jgi:hypothetical protein